LVPSRTSRNLLALFSACGFVVSILAYLASFTPLPIDSIYPWFILLLLGWMAVLAPMCILEYPATRTLTFSLKGFARRMPSWVAPCSWLLLFIAIAHLAWTAVQFGRGAPEIIDGRYVLGSRGGISEALTQAEYLRLRAIGARMFATFLIYFYFVPMVYWWFRRNQQAPI
jgi:hypothetical protein